MQFKGLTFGIPKEIMHGERRVAAIPETVKKLVAGGAGVLVEKGAGEGAYFSDEEYSNAGARIVGDVEELLKQADVVLKVKEPLFNSAKGKHEVDMLHEGQSPGYILASGCPSEPRDDQEPCSKRCYRAYA